MRRVSDGIHATGKGILEQWLDLLREAQSSRCGVGENASAGVWYTHNDGAYWQLPLSLCVIRCLSVSSWGFGRVGNIDRGQVRSTERM